MKGLTANIEDKIKDVLAALKLNGQDIFKTVDVWKHQIGVTESGMMRFDAVSPFAFVSHSPSSMVSQGPTREGSYDLNDHLRFSVLIGCSSKEEGVARRGDDRRIGCSYLRDAVIDALEDWHPGEGFAIDNFYYEGENETLDAPKQYAMELLFAAARIRE